MNKLILYIAMSLDGYIAEKDGGIRFLEETPNPSSDLGYEKFYSSVQAALLGGKTYRQIKNDLSPGKWPYEGMPCYVCTRQQHPFDPQRPVHVFAAGAAGIRLNFQRSFWEYLAYGRRGNHPLFYA